MITNANTNDETVNTENTGCDVNRLSKLQRQVLVALWRELRLRERDFEQSGKSNISNNGRRGNWHGEFGGNGCRPSIGWQWQVVFDTPPTRAQCAALSRALRRLEERNFVERSSTPGKNTRTVALEVTDQGRAVASCLAGEKDPYPTLAEYLKATCRESGPSLESLEQQIKDALNG